jgi:glycosyltransferase involved in cell wall biosynthesis
VRIAYICADPGVPVFGQKGCSIHVQEMLRAFQRQGASVSLFATRLGGNPPQDLVNIPIYRLPPIPKVEPEVRERVALATNPDIRLELELAGSFDLIYERYSLWSYSGMEYAAERRIPGILEVNAPLIEEQAKHRGLVDREGAERVANRAFQAASQLIAVSSEIKTYLKHYVRDDKIQVIANGVNSDRFSFPLIPALPTSPEIFTVGFVGSLKPWHGLPILAQAFALLKQRLPNSRLLIVGDGTERTNLEAELSAQGLLDAVRFTGAVPPNEIPGLLASMSVAVAPYRDGSDFYFSPLKVYEYMAAGLPVVASRIGQIAELIEDEVNGLLCPPGNAEALATALERLWHSPKLRLRLGKAARSTVMQSHTWDAIAERILILAGLGIPL